MKTGIYYYQNAFHDMQLLHTMIATLKRAGIDATPLTDLGDTETLCALDALVVLGGDGTMLPAAVASGKAGIPVVGINYGHLGFLTEFECGEWEAVVDLLLRRDARIERRSAIEVTVRGKSFYALNEVTIQRQYNDQFHRQLIGIEARIDQKLVDRYQADGLIICTPTGSTAYSLSAGGAVLSPDLSAYMITPLCAHSLRSRPIVYSDERELEISLTDDYAADIFCDGKRCADIDGNEMITLRKAPFSVDFLMRNKSNFYDKLFFKLNQWGGGDRDET